LDFHKDISHVIDGHFTGRENYENKNLRLKRHEQTNTKCAFTNEIILFSKMSRLTLRPTLPPIQ
jgi:hypothetical protein